MGGPHKKENGNIQKILVQLLPARAWMWMVQSIKTMIFLILRLCQNCQTYEVLTKNLMHYVTFGDFLDAYLKVLVDDLNTSLEIFEGPGPQRRHEQGRV